ncbi:hypothetical protein [Rhodococcus globerulus]|nr:hypothetical protein [Rhodococcus globerulus]MCE4265491.1 hypothetical protein [Rhodococcus globerulus]
MIKVNQVVSTSEVEKTGDVDLVVVCPGDPVWSRICDHHRVNMEMLRTE